MPPSPVMRGSPFLADPSVDGVSPCPAMAQAATMVLAEWTDVTADSAHNNEASDVLILLAHALQTNPVPTLPEEVRSPLGRRLLQLLRRQVLRGLSGSSQMAPGAEVVRIMENFEIVQEQIEPQWSEHFAAKLASPDGLDLVVEVAHDLRSPLTSILFLAETLQRGQSGPLTDIQHRQLGLIYGAGLGLSSLASNVIELARGGDKLLDDEPSPFSVTEILESVRDILKPIAEEKGLAIRLHPPMADHRLGHPIALSRVLLNLTTNALKFTDEGFVELKVTSGQEDLMEFSVRDTGPGLNQETVPGLYQPFRRAGGREGGYRFSGTGLGLTISRKLVEAMDSKLELETRPDWGTRFYFRSHLPQA